jgi:myo-inositol 2-dehydrogenase/D-chiro-inositol 1-dehydrogenase
MARTIRYGIIGAGMMGCEHIRNITAMDDAVVTALADPHEESLRWGRLACGEGSAVETYTDVSEMLARAPIDAVVIASPNFTHAEVLDRVFETDKHVLIEKPMCTTLKDCERVVEAAAQHPGIVWVGLEYRYMPPIARFVAELERGAVGDIKMLFIREHRHPFLPKVADWNRFNRYSGGTLVEKCCHFFDLMNLIMPTPARRVYASGGQDVNHLDERYDGETPDILDNAFVTIDYEDGARACLDLCMFAESSRNEQELMATGSAGKLDCSLPDGRMVRGARKYRKYEELTNDAVPEIAHVGFHHGASYLEHIDFLQAIREGAPVRVTPRDGLRSVAIGVAAHRSIDEGRPIDLSEITKPGELLD